MPETGLEEQFKQCGTKRRMSRVRKSEAMWYAYQAEYQDRDRQIYDAIHNKQTNGSNAKKRRAPWKLQPLSFRKRFAVFCLIFGGGMLFYMMSFIFGMPEGVLMADFLEGITTQMIAFIFSFVPNGEALAQPIYNGFQLTPIGIVIGMFMVAVVAMLAISLIYTVVMTKKAHDAAAPKFMIS